MAKQQAATARRVAEKYETKTQVSKSEKKLLFFLTLGIRHRLITRLPTNTL